MDRHAAPDGKANRLQGCLHQGGQPLRPQLAADAFQEDQIDGRRAAA